MTEAPPLVPADFDLTVGIDHVMSRLTSGMTIGIGGWGSRRKPMALVHAIAHSDLTDLTIVSFGGPDVGILCARGKVKKLVFGFVSLDIQWVNSEDSGVYTCHATNNYGEDSTSANVKCRGKF